MSDRAAMKRSVCMAIAGVKAALGGAKPGPTVALTVELDALLLPEHPCAQPSIGAAHACGHNARIAGLMVAALGLCNADVASQLSGNVDLEVQNAVFRTRQFDGARMSLR